MPAYKSGFKASEALKVPTRLPFSSLASHSTRSTKALVVTPETVTLSSKQISSSVGKSSAVISGSPTTSISIVFIMFCVAHGSLLLSVAVIVAIPVLFGSKVGSRYFRPCVITPSAGSTDQDIL